MSDGHGLLGSDDLVTGEAVALDLPPATVGLRVASGLIDVGLLGLLLFFAFLTGIIATSGSEAALTATATILALAGVLIGIPTAVETLTRGKSVGKLALGLRTVRDDAGPIAFRHSFVRSLVGVVEIWMMSGVPALICALVSARGKRIGDVAAGTYVVRERFRLPAVRHAVMPLHLAGWAAAADMAPLPDGLALAVRQFLDRAGSLNPVSRAQLGQQLEQQVMAQVAPAPPPGQHAETILAAVVAERRRRDEMRLARDEQVRQRLRGLGPQQRR